MFIVSHLSFPHFSDIKLDNILLDDNWIAKMTDFGFAKKIADSADGKVTMSTTFCGTLPYECPQILEHKAYNGFKADIWSMGVSFFIMLHDRFPFHFRDRKMMLKEIYDYPAYLRTRYVAKLPNDANRLIEELLHPEERRRGSVQTILKSPYLRSQLSN